MKLKTRISLSAFIALSVAGLAALVIVRYQTKNSYRAAFSEDKKIDLKIDRIHYSGTKEGHLEWELDADSATRFKDDDIIRLDKVKAVFFPRDGTAPYTLTAKEGTYRESTGDIDATGDVTVTSGALFRLKAGVIRYSVKGRKITSDGPVDITSRGMDVKGVGLFVELDRGTLKLLRNVKAVL